VSSKRRNTVIVLCGVLLVGVLSVTIGRVPTGEVQAVVLQQSDDEQGQALAESLMDQWKRENPSRADEWITEEKERHALQPPYDNSRLLGGAQEEGQTYAEYTEVDLLMWERETEKLVVDGSRIFHDAEALGGTVGVSCDMCHPHAANTHPETYPKYQAQMGRVALLRDMINWCIEQPVRGQRFAADDERMRALEAYIYAQRSGTELSYGKH
jgi:thiosulfate dehydrogenase